MKEDHDLSGIWQSLYSYGRGRQSKHRVKLQHIGKKINGSSIVDISKSELTFDLELERNFLTGTWRERTSHQGEYKGKIFFGALQFILDPRARRMEGKWVGFNKDESEENTGEWALTEIRASSDINLEAAKLFTDGGSRGNPGPSAGAFLICKMDDNVVEKSGFYIGITTNNQAEYQALLKALQRSAELGIRKLKVFMDSELIVKQLNGVYKIKNKDLMPLYHQIKELVDGFEEISFNYVPRAMNKEADAEVNRILDKQAT